MSIEHEVFSKDVGTWDAEIEVRPGPGAAPERSKGVAVNKLVGGSWLVIDFENDSGFQGHGVYGWDPAKQKYVGTWVDSMRTFLSPMEGTWDAATKTMTLGDVAATLRASVDDPAAALVDVVRRRHTTLPDDMAIVVSWL